MPALLLMGFRPFYLGAAVFASLAVPFWVWGFTTGALPGLLPWHAHEMIFGFAPAVMVGFLLTAVRNWTNRPTLQGGRLAALFGLWLAARLANGVHLPVPAMLLDTTFLLASALAVGVPIWQARNRRNAFVVVLLVALAALSALHGAATQNWLRWLPPAWATTLALDLVLLLMVVIGGRVIPAFSGNAVAGLNPRSWPVLEWVAVGSIAAIFAADLARPGEAPTWLFFAAAAAHSARLAGWQPWKTRGNVLLLALPLAYLWIPAHLLLRALEPQLATHALTVGAMANLMLAMMTRSALGHTGRPLQARAVEVLCFASLQLAALSRVFGILFFPGGYAFWLWAAVLGWCLGFGTFSAAYWPILTRPRVDSASGS